MPTRQGLTRARATAGLAVVNIGTVVPAGMKRYIYAIATQSAAAANTLSLRVALAGVVVDTFFHVLAGDRFEAPNVMLDNALALYVAQGGAQVNLQTDVGNCDVDIWYEDEYA